MDTDRRRLGVTALVAIVSALSLVACRPVGGPAAAPTTGAGPAGAPNIVFVLTDDLAWNLVQYMPAVQRLQADGMTFTNYTVADSLCCPSRSSIFTGNFPHDT